MRRKHLILLTLLIVLVATTAIQLASAEITITIDEPLLPPVTEQKQTQDITTSDLAVISGLTEQAVLDLYTALGNWEIITENIFVYKQILALATREADEYTKLLSLIQHYDAGAILTVLQFLADKQIDFDRAEVILALSKQGQSLEEVLTQTLADKEYQRYIPADQDQIRQWLAAGYLPQDIINADAIAMTQDLSISNVLVLKSGDNTWEQIGQELGYHFDQEVDQEASVTVTVATTAGTEILTAANYLDLVDQANERAELKKSALEQDLLTQFELPEDKLAEYQQQGMNLHEIKNMLRLAEETGSAAEEILNDKKGGMGWKGIIEKHTVKQGRKPNE